MSETESQKSERVFQIVTGFDFSKLGDRAFFASLQMAAQHRPAELHAITVGNREGEKLRLKDPEGESQLLEEAQAAELAREHVAGLVHDFQERFGGCGLERVAVYVVTGGASERILALSRRVDADLIVVGTHGRSGIKRLVLGSVAEEIVKQAECGVFVVRPRDFYKGEQVPEIQPALQPGDHSLRHFSHRPTYHYVDRVSNYGSRMMPTY